MIKAEINHSPDKKKGSIKMELHGTPDVLGAEMHIFIKGFVRNLLEPCYPEKKLQMSMFLAKRFAQAVHEAYQEHMQGAQGDDSEL